MKIIIDNNILFALLNPNSIASKILENKNISFISPNYIKSEFEEHEHECLKKSSLSKEEFEKRKDFVYSKIIFINVEEYKHFLKKAVKILSDLDDVPYIALALAFSLPIWSNDKQLRNQSLVPVIITEELLNIIF